MKNLIVLIILVFYTNVFAAGSPSVAFDQTVTDNQSVPVNKNDANNPVVPVNLLVAGNDLPGVPSGTGPGDPSKIDGPLTAYDQLGVAGNPGRPNNQDNGNPCTVPEDNQTACSARSVDAGNGTYRQCSWTIDSSLPTGGMCQ
jgi:hypothetical protein